MPQVAWVRHVTSDVWDQTPNIRRRTSDIWDQTCDFRRVLSDIWLHTSHISHIRHRASNIWHIPGIWCQTFHERGQTSDVWYMFDVRRLMCDVGCLISEIWYQISEIRRLTSDMWHQTSDNWIQTSDIRRLRSNVWHQHVRGREYCGTEVILICCFGKCQ